jgi:EAL domain-containing protein (putative c-di-GMP-specific phosphodiesterase class I)
MFIRDIVDDPIDRVMVRSINEIGHVMGKKMIAEFVENDAVLAVLRSIGVDYVQGYGIEHPVPLASFSAIKIYNFEKKEI